MAGYTLGLLAVGALVGLGQIFITVFQLRYTAKAANTAESALKMAERAFDMMPRHNEGRFNFKNLAPGRYRISVQREGGILRFCGRAFVTIRQS